MGKAGGKQTTSGQNPPQPALELLREARRAQPEPQRPVGAGAGGGRGGGRGRGGAGRARGEARPPAQQVTAAGGAERGRGAGGVPEHGGGARGAQERGGAAAGAPGVVAAVAAAAGEVAAMARWIPTKRQKYGVGECSRPTECGAKLGGGRGRWVRAAGTRPGPGPAPGPAPAPAARAQADPLPRQLWGGRGAESSGPRGGS